MAKSKSPFRHVPAPGATLEEMRASIEALKENVETLMGQRGPRGTSSQVFFVDPKNAQEVPEGTNDGDIWIQTPKTGGSGWSISVWKDGKWV